MLACSSPWLIAAGHVFRRRLVPLASTLCSCSLDYLILRPIFLLFVSDKIATGLNNLFSRYSRPSYSLCSCQGTWGFRPDGSASLGEFLLLEGFLTPCWVRVLPFSGLPFRTFILPGSPLGDFRPWWVAVDSNHRPLAYQASALTN